MFGFQYQTYISYIEDTHQILFGSANSFKSYCVHIKSPRTYVPPNIQTDSQTDRRKFFLACFVFQDIQILNICQKERISFFFTHAITILSLCTYFVCDEKVKIYITLLNYLSWRPQAGRLVISDNQAADTLNVNKCVFVSITHVKCPIKTSLDRIVVSSGAILAVIKFWE